MATITAGMNMVRRPAYAQSDETVASTASVRNNSSSLSHEAVKTLFRKFSPATPN